MSDEPEDKSPPKRPLSDRSTEAGAFRRQLEDGETKPPREPIDWTTEARAFKKRHLSETPETEAKVSQSKLDNWETVARAFRNYDPDHEEEYESRQLSDRTTEARAFKGRVFQPEEDYEESDKVQPKKHKPPKRSATQSTVERRTAGQLAESVVVAKESPLASVKGKDLAHGDFMPPTTEDLPYVTLEGDSLLERILPKFLGAMAIFLISGLVSYFVISKDLLKFADDDKEAIPQVLEDMSLVSRPSSLRADGTINPGIAIVEENTISLGGYERLKRLSSVALRGVLLKDGRSINFSLYALRPNYYRLVYELGEDQYIIGYDGKTGWEEYKRDGISIRSGLLTKGESLELQLLVDFDLPPQKYILVDEYTVGDQTPVMAINSLPRDFIDDEMYDVIRIKEEGRPSTVAYIDASDNYLYQTIVSLEGMEYRTVYEDYRKYEGTYYPMRREQYIDDEFVAKIEIKEVDFNPGMLLNMFSPPNSLQKRN